jgi:hypothetical protein
LHISGNICQKNKEWPHNSSKINIILSLINFRKERKKGRKEGKKERKEGRKEGKEGERKEGRKEGRKEVISLLPWTFKMEVYE